METRIAVLSIIIEEEDQVGVINETIHHYAQYMVGRMGIPYRSKCVNIICLVMDGPQNAVSELSGKLGKLPGVTTKVAYAKKSASGKEPL